MPRTVVVTNYDPEWPLKYEQEAAALQGALGYVFTACHHIGSTSVHGLPAKPIIDIMLEVPNLEALDARVETFRNLGYEALGEYGIPERRFYQKGGDARTHHIHAFKADSAAIHRHLCLRDYLREHSEEAACYGELKRQLARKFHDDVARYVEEKAPYVSGLEQRALGWGARLRRQSYSSVSR